MESAREWETQVFTMDASWTSQIVGVGILLRDSRGAIRQAFTKRLLRSPSLEHAKACAMLEYLGNSKFVF